MMKTIILYSSVILASLAFQESKAQVRVNINIGQPVYVAPAPVAVSYYYLPDVEAYYYVPQKIYYYRSGPRWVSARYLPGRRNYNVYNVRHIVVNEHRPWDRHDHYRSKYNHVRTASYNEHRRSDYRRSEFKSAGYRDRDFREHTRKQRGRGRH